MNIIECPVGGCPWTVSSCLRTGAVCYLGFGRNYVIEKLVIGLGKL